jgi:hypothetical protein
MAKYKLTSSGVQITDITDPDNGAFVPNRRGNRHWEAYLLWLEKGNTPDPQYTPEELLAKQKKEVDAAIELLITIKMKEMAAAELKKEGKIPLDYKVK